MQIGTIESIWRYPVKGMCGEEIPHTYTAFTGLMGDRVYAWLQPMVILGIRGIPGATKKSSYSTKPATSRASNCCSRSNWTLHIVNGGPASIRSIQMPSR